jgi:hypothetical protein
VIFTWKCPFCLGENTDTRNTFVICVECGQTYDKIPPYPEPPGILHGCVDTKPGFDKEA